MRLAALVVALALVGCGGSGTSAPAPAAAAKPGCDGSADGYRVRGRVLRGDVDGDGAADRVSLRVDRRRPPRCRYLLAVDDATAPVRPFPWPGTDPRLLLLAEIDGRAGLEPVVTLSPAAVYRPGAVFTIRNGRLVRMRPALMPLADEFPASVDCTQTPGTIVVTVSQPAQPDSHWKVTRTTYRAAGRRFVRVEAMRFKARVGTEVVGRSFRSC